MFVSNAYAQAAGAAPAADPTTAMILNLAPFILIFVIMWFLVIRPQQRRVKEHQALIAAIKRGDTVETAGGIIGKVDRVADDELRVEIAPGVLVRVVRGTVTGVRVKGEPAPANDSQT
ncbi:MAG: preprotein translocase subunit YajC [Caulobacterales bacterium]